MMIHKFVLEGRTKEIDIERLLLKELDHPSIINFYASFRPSKCNKFYLLIEYSHNRSLSTFISNHRGKLTTPLVKHFAAEIVEVLEYLRSKQVVHRDLKPGNIVLDKRYHLKLIDFATCKVFNHEILAQINEL